MVNRVLLHLHHEHRRCRAEHLRNEAMAVAEQMEAATGALLTFVAPTTETIQDDGFVLNWWIDVEPKPIRSLADVETQIAGELRRIALMLTEAAKTLETLKGGV